MTNKKEFASIAAFVLIAVVMSLLGSLLLGVLVGGAVAAGIYFFLNDKKPGASDEKTSEPASETNETEMAIESLLGQNLSLRKAIIPAEVRDSYEKLIDMLLDLLPKANDEAQGTELCWVINRIASEYLPEKSLKPYLALDEARRSDETSVASVMEGIAGMTSELNEVAAMLNNRNTNEFNAKAKFLKHRFNV